MGIKLRALTKEDARITWKWRNDEDIKYFFSGHPFYVNLEKEEEWFSRVLYSDIPTCILAIEEIQSKNLIGLVFLKDIHQINRSAEFAILIGEKNSRGKGYAKKSTKLMIDFAFNDLNLNRVFLKVQEDNDKAIKLYKKCEFQVEGILRQSIFKKGKYMNEIIMSIIKTEKSNNEI